MKVLEIRKKDAYPFLNDLDLSDDVKRRVSLLLNRTELGNSEIFYTPLGSEGKADTILTDVDNLFSENSELINSTLRDLELSNKDKFGPRSIAVPWLQRKDTLLESFKPFKTKDKLEIPKAALPSRLRPIGISQAINLLKNDTNSGLPYYIRKSEIKESISQDFDSLLNRRDPCLLFTRTQEGNKTRNVWGYPVADTLNEMRFYSPLLEYQRNKTYRAALLGPDEVGRITCELVLKAQSELRTLVSIDFSAFDNSVKAYLHKYAFDYIKSLFQPKFGDELNYINERFSSIGIVTPDGVLNGNHGVPSGSTFTNEVDSIVQMLIGVSLPYISLESMLIQGDDGVYIIPNGKEEEVFDHFSKFGLSVNRDKSYVSKDYVTFLQCLYHIDYINKGIIGGIYPIYRALNRLCYQERWSDFEDFGINGKDYYSIRALCILENCKWHPLFEKFVKLILSKDKYSLGFSSQGLSNYVHMIEKTKGTEGILVNQYGDNVNGIRSFE